MAFLVSDVVGKVRDHLSGFYLATDPRAVQMVEDAHRQICKRCELYGESSFTITPVVGQALYAFDPTFFRIHAATYVTDAQGGGWPLRETSISQLDHRHRRWRQTPPSDPQRYYRDGTSLGFWPAPGTLPAPYPRIVVAGLAFTTLSALTDPLPAQLDNTDAYVWNVCYRWAAEHQPGDADYYGKLAGAALGDLKRMIDNILVRQPPQVVANIPRIRGR